jgi:hypothetical protein
MAPSPRVIKTVKGAGRVYDWRGTGLLPPNGGRIKLLIAIEHIPVVANKPGVTDFVALANVLNVQGLSLQTATDSEGNVALYNPLDALCYQARGSNSFSYGTEHMHMSVTEAWDRKQLNASAWIWQYAEREYGVPIQTARLGHGNPTPVWRKGHTSHRTQSQMAGYNDRVDPGPGYDWTYVAHAAKFYKRHGTFVGA